MDKYLFWPIIFCGPKDILTKDFSRRRKVLIWKFFRPKIFGTQYFFSTNFFWDHNLIDIDPTPKFKSYWSLTLKTQVLYDLGFSGSEQAPPAPLGWYFHLKINFSLFYQLISGTTITLIVLLNKNDPYRRRTDEGLVANINDILMGGILCLIIFWIHQYKEYSYVSFCCCWQITITKQQKIPGAFFRVLRVILIH